MDEPMDENTRMILEQLRSEDGSTRFQALNDVLKLTDEPVPWAYEVWDGMLADLRHANGHQRAIAAQVLCNLAKSDPEGRMLRDFDTLVAVTRDNKFVTARHCLQALWKAGTAGELQQRMVVDRLAGRFADCAAEKNCTLIRFDIIEGMKKLFDQVKDESIKTRALALIETEPDAKYRKKYATVWRDVAGRRVS
jgi:hypothetical protein